MSNWTVKLTYYKPSGKYYSEGEYVTSASRLLDVWNEVEKMINSSTLPGLATGGHGYFIVQVDVPECPQNHPHIMNTFGAVDNHRRDP